MGGGVILGVGYVLSGGGGGGSGGGNSFNIPIERNTISDKSIRNQAFILRRAKTPFFNLLF